MRQEQQQQPRRRMPRAAREQLMVKVATEAFAERGYNATSMEEVAEAAGVTKPMVYAYFGSKEGLYVACMQEISGPLLREIEGGDATLPADRQLWQGIMVFFSYVAEHRDAWTRLYLDASAIGGEAAVAAEAVRQEVVEVVSQLIVAGARAEGVNPHLLPHIEPLAHAFVGASEALTRWWLSNPDESTELIASRLMNFAWLGFGHLMKGGMWTPETGETHV